MKNTEEQSLGVALWRRVRRSGNVHPGYAGQELKADVECTHKLSLAQQNYTLYFFNRRYAPGCGLTRETLLNIGSCFPPNTPREPMRSPQP